MTTLNAVKPDFDALTLAQLFYLDLCRNANFGRTYKAPHANFGTPPKPHYKRGYVTTDEEGNPVKRIIRKKLFRGHRR